MYLLGISAYFHDSAAVLLKEGVIVAAAQEEGFSRIKHDSNFPCGAIRFCLDEANITIDDLDYVVYYEKPFLKFERLLDTYVRFSPKGLRTFLKAIPIWLKEKLFIKKNILDGLSRIQPFEKKKLKLLFSEHHLSHAASAYFMSPFNEAAVLTIDGVGEWATTSIFHAKENKLTHLKEIHFPDSLGLFYSAFTYFLGFRVNSGEYKLMGLAPYGDINDPQTVKFIDIIKSRIILFYPDGSFKIKTEMVNYPTGTKMINDGQWSDLFGFTRRKPEEPFETHHYNLALAVQSITDECVINLATEAKKITACNSLCMAGGVALNCVANGRLRSANIFENIFIQPASGDAGGALGAALSAHHIFHQRKKEIYQADGMQYSYLGPSFSEKQAVAVSEKLKMSYQVLAEEQMLSEVASRISSGSVVGWFQGKMEFGPRALGNRSILADPRNKSMRQTLNFKIKFREGFRPFAPSVKFEKVNEYFEPGNPSPYMTFIYQVKSGAAQMPAITHADGSARVQTVTKESNTLFWSLLNEFEKLTGHPMLINTSFNVRGEPMVCTPEDAIKCFMNTEMDLLVIGNIIFNKQSQKPEAFAACKKEMFLDD